MNEMNLDDLDVDFDDTGDVLTIAEFESMVRSGALTDDDGYGFFMDEVNFLINEEHDVMPSLVDSPMHKALSNNWTHIIWYNR